MSEIIEPEDILSSVETVIFDCRYSLTDPGEGEALYREGHIPGAHYLDLNQDMSAPVSDHGGRHPLPDPTEFAARLAGYKVGPQTEVVAYDDSRFAYAARLWWLMKSLGYKPPRLLNGGYRGWLDAGFEPDRHELSGSPASGLVEGEIRSSFEGYCDIEGLRGLQGQGATVIDSRERVRYRGLEEPIDPVAGHIPGAINRPWQDITDPAGRLLHMGAQRALWGDALAAEQLVVYCGSGVTACVNLFSLAALGRGDATLYAGSWSDWCSYL